MSDWIKAPVILLGFGCGVPLLAWLLSRRREWQRFALALMVFMTSWHINKLTLMLGSVEWYRGHTKGFEANLIQLVACGLLGAQLLEGRARVRWLPAGAFLWLGYCALSMLSLFAAPNAAYVWMAGWKFVSAAVLFVVAWNALRDERDWEILVRALAVTLIVQAAVVLKCKYFDGQYQVRGWFEHQNPLAMWAYMIGLPLFAVGLADAGRTGRWAMGGFFASALIVQSSLSRASLVIFAVGVALVATVLLLWRPNPHKLRVVGLLLLAGTVGLLGALDSVVARFHDEGNTASGETRSVMNLASRAMLADSFVGLGWNNFALTINAPFSYGDVINQWEADRGHRVDDDYAKGVVESHYWLLLGETGWPGLLGYLLFIAATAWWCLAGAWRHRSGALGAFLLGVLIAVLLTYAHSHLERVLTQTKSLSLWLLLLGASARIRTWKTGVPSS